MKVTEAKIQKQTEMQRQGQKCRNRDSEKMTETTAEIQKQTEMHSQVQKCRNRDRE